jgi:hypothetical protein
MVWNSAVNVAYQATNVFTCFAYLFRQQNLEHIPQALFLPAHVVMERESDRQVQMERKVEELFSHDYDPVDLKGLYH